MNSGAVRDRKSWSAPRKTTATASERMSEALTVTPPPRLNTPDGNVSCGRARKRPPTTMTKMFSMTMLTPMEAIRR